MMTAVFVDRLDLLQELDDIGAALMALERRFGGVAEFTCELADARRRQQHARAVLLEPLHVLLTTVDAVGGDGLIRFVSPALPTVR